jgi:SWI/SNF-related matrix-associated actin-dependent regulator of chromatin subfamily A member 5
VDLTSIASERAHATAGLQPSSTFDGAEAGPPYVDGPHLSGEQWQMLLLNKLPLKVERASQEYSSFLMTRVLDILEDYCRLVGHEYCRIDGNTDGEKRDSQMDSSTRMDRASLSFAQYSCRWSQSILATADIVILYDRTGIPG